MSRSCRVVTSLLVVVLLLAGGCAQKNRVQVEQPFAPYSQRNMELTSRWGYTAPADGRQIVLLEFPLPAAVRGFRAFRVYAETPAGFGTYPIDPGNPAAARAFFVQEVGELQGKVVMRGGQVRVDAVPFGGEQTRIVLDLEGANDFRITGDVRVVTDPIEIDRFLREFQPDVQALRDLGRSGRGATSRPVAERPGQTPTMTASEAPPPPPEPEPGEVEEADTFLFEQE